MNAAPESQEVRRLPWVASLYQALKIEQGASLQKIFARTDEAATRLAPGTRRLWRWILTFEGAAVLLPTFWLLVLRLRWAPAYTAYAVLVCTLTVVGACWWMRWRGMQRTWTHARLVAEIARSMLATSWLPGRVTVDAMAGAPTLQSVATDLPPAETGPVTTDLDQIKERYIRERILDQLDNYYILKRDIAVKDRQRLSRYVTWSLDGALFLAAAGVVLVLSGRSAHLLRISGSDYVLGLIGTTLPLVAILMQSLSSYLELSRRNARYAQQIEFLKAAQVRLKAAPGMPEALAVMSEVEHSLLAEVVEWFYQAEHAELFYRSKKTEAAFTGSKAAPAHRGWLGRMLDKLGVGMSWTVFVIFRRLLVVAVSVVATVVWIAFRAPYDYSATSELRVGDGWLLSSAGAGGWDPQPEHSDHGFILIAHGLHDGVPPKAEADKSGAPSSTKVKEDKEAKTKEEEPLHWMSLMEEALERKLGGNVPDICLVDWHDAAANPSTLTHDWVSDIAAVRSQASLIGQLVGYKLAMAIKEKRIRRDQPMHFIGHSAGGFVILSAARVLISLNLAPKELRLTILDTPEPDTSESGDLEEVLKMFPVDYYCTSTFTKNDVPADHYRPKFTRFDVPPPPNMSGILEATQAHSYSHDWFTKTIEEYADQRGFARSPFSATAPH